MSKIKIDSRYGLCCLDETCSFKHECANHASAGDYRTEDGFKPELEKRGNEIHCLTKDRKIDEDIDYADFPENIHDLYSGCMTIKELETRSAINYSI